MTTQNQREQCLSLIQSFNELTRGLTLESLDDSKPEARDLLRQLSKLSSRLHLAFTAPADIVVTQAFSLNLAMAIRVLLELKVFEILSTQPDSASQDERQAKSWSYSSKKLAELTNAEEQLLVRLLRCAEVLGYVDVLSPAVYTPNAITFALSNPSLAAGVTLCYDNAARPNSNLSALLDYFRKEGYHAPSDARDGPWQRANDTVGRTTWEVWHTNGSPPESWPGERERFNLFMEGSRHGHRMWFEWWESEWRALVDGFYIDRDDPRHAAEPLIVDLGGGHGHDLDAFHRKYPDLPGRLVLTDLPSVLAEVDRAKFPSAIEVVPQDLFEPFKLEIQGAKIYYLHMNFHDWPDTDCIKFLEHIRDAMTPGHSRILINDAILPDKGAAVIQAAFDMTMMAHHCGIERDRSMWKALIDNVNDLEVVGMWEYPGGEGIIEVKRV